MANLKEVRTRIESVNSTKQITSAMKMVAASKLRKSQNAIMALRPYAEKFSEIMERISSQQSETGNNVSAYAESRPVERVLIVPLSSNKGLCGVFNANVIRSTTNLIHEEYQTQYDNNKVDILCVGSKVEESLKFKKYPVMGNENHILDNLTYENAVLLAEKLMAYYAEKKYDRIVFVYNQFKNAATQVLVHEQFLPIVSRHDVNVQQTSQSEIDYIFQPNKEDIYNEMLPKSLKMQVYKILLDSFASEQGARMISMTQATDNATELLKELNLTYNKARQSAITNELVEIVSGADALKG
ncbi:MAG: ATP synthase F1 subunit gamma [Bacteroidales bacterium]|nr:ATP synthase F1 subunit gamma [Bacteroidales bacterium]